MGRIVYQPITEENASDSIHGQLIVNQYNGHISVNHNNVINSATKRIEKKLNDVYQLQENINQQTNVIDNLSLDYDLFCNEMMNTIYDSVYEAVSNMSSNSVKLKYLIKGVGFNSSDNKSILETLIDSIKQGISNAEAANAYHNTSLESFNNDITRINKLIADTKNTIEEDYTSIQILKTKLNGKLNTSN